MAAGAGGGGAEQTLTAFAKAGVDHHALAAQLQAEGAQSFDRSWQNPPTSIASRHERLTTTGS